MQPFMPQSAHVLFEYGQNRDGYWNDDCFMKQMETAIKVAEANILCEFSNMCGCSTTHVATHYAADALVAGSTRDLGVNNQP